MMWKRRNRYMADYFYDKYALIIDYEEVPETVKIPEKSYTVYTDNVIEENLSNKGITMTYDQGLYYQYKFKSSYSVQVRRKYTDTIKDHMFVLSGDTNGETVPLNSYIYRKISDYEIEMHRPYFRTYDVKRPAGLNLILKVQKHAILRLERRKMTTGGGTEEVIRIVERHSKGELLETNVVKDSSYPVNGPKDGYWWVRKGLYTIPPPELISPENAFMLNRKTGEEMPSFEFLLVPREIDDQNLYHVRIRIGTHSDFSDYDVYLESKEDTTGWECFLDGKWVPFPAEGVPAGTRVRINPKIEAIGFGFWYWDATAYNSNWGYGVSSQHRLIIVIDEADRPFIVSINGISYNPLELRVSESSNGELGSIEIVLSNHNI